MTANIACELCAQPGGEPLWADDRLRIVRVEGAEGAAFPGFCRVIWHAHVAEMSALTEANARHLLAVTLAVERALRGLLAPTKINLASLGNAVPHLHWHVIPRWADDSHFPRPIWAAALREGTVPAAPSRDALIAALHRELAAVSAVSAAP